jgi:hypothetical protein
MVVSRSWSYPLLGGERGAISDIVRNAKEQIKKDHRVVSKVKRVNPHFKM